MTAPALIWEAAVSSGPANASASRPFVFDDGAAYELMMGRWSALVAHPFLGWLALPAGLEWLDDGCGDGSFTRAVGRRWSASTLRRPN